MSDRNCVTDALKDLHGEGSKRDIVLVVDDEEEIRNILERIMRLVAPELKIVLAENGEDAISQISEALAGRVAIVFTDTEMPGENGIELAEALKGKDATPEILEDMERVPVVINSGNHDYQYPGNPKGDAMQALIDRGTADVFIPKPYDVDQLRDAMVKAIKRVQERFQEQPTL